MDSSFVIYLGRHTLETALLISSPILLTCMGVGLAVTLFQALTSMRDMTLTTVPKLIAVGFMLVLCSGWMLGMILRFTNEIFGYVQSMGG